MKRILSISAALSLALAALFASSVPAFAHTDEMTTSPEAGSTVEAGRIPITMTFGEELLVGDDSISHEVVVTNSEGAIMPALCASSEGFDLSTAAALDQPGEYTVTWRTVSADGHPTSGDFKFNLVNTTEYDAASDAVDACVYAMATSGSGEMPTLYSDAEDGSNALMTGLFIGSAFLVVLVVIAIATRKTLKARVANRKRKSE